MKNRYKKILASALAAAMTISLAACGSTSGNDTDGDKKEKVELTGMVQQSRWYLRTSEYGRKTERRGKYFYRIRGYPG